MSTKKILISTGGGDAPGLNAVVKAVTCSALHRGWEVYGVRDALDGLVIPELFANRGVFPLTREVVAPLTPLGGTFLGTTNRGRPFEYPVRNEEGNVIMKDVTDDVMKRISGLGIEALISVGGDGALTIAKDLIKHGVRVIGVPKTIDNDLDATEVTFGFDTAVSFATECIDRLRSTAESHRRAIVVEVMGRHAGWIALHAGIASSAEVILIPEIPYSLTAVVRKLRERQARNERSSLVVVAEGAMQLGGDPTVRAGSPHRLGGIGEKLTADIEREAGQEARCVVLGHLLRGGSPTAQDRILGLRFGAAAVRAVEEGLSNVMVSLQAGEIRYVPIEQAVHRLKTVSPDSDMVKMAKEMGISFGEEE